MSKQTHWKRKKGSSSGEDYFNTSKVRKERGPVGSSDIEVEQIESNNTNVSDILNKANRVLFNEPVPVFPASLHHLFKNLSLPIMLPWQPPLMLMNLQSLQFLEKR